jgi:hypothetical protein
MAKRKKTPKKKQNESKLPARFSGEHCLTIPSAVLCARAELAIARHRDELLKLPGVEGLSIGDRYRGGMSTGEIAIRLHLGSEKKKEELRQAALSKQVDLKPSYDGIPVDLIVWHMDLRNNGVAAATGFSDGQSIQSSLGGGGTLGTTAILGSETVGITAAHVVWPARPPAGEANISGAAGEIGIVSDHPVFAKWDDFVDCAIIFPTSTLPKPVSGRRIRRVTIADMNLPVTMHGAETK